MKMKKSTKFVIVSVLGLACVISFMWFGLYQRYQSPKKYIELFGESGFTVVKTSSKLDLGSENVIMTYSMNQFVDSMTRWGTAKLREPGGGIQTNETIKWALGSEMRDPIIYWYKESGKLVFYYINIQGQSVAFVPQFG